METKIKIPELGVKFTDGILVKWLKQSGDFVKENEAIAEVENYKASLEIGAPCEGVLKIDLLQGSQLAFDSTLGTIQHEHATISKSKTPVRLYLNLSNEEIEKLESIKAEDETYEQHLIKYIKNYLGT